MTVMLANGFAQDNTKIGLPDGAIARLGKGGINLIAVLTRWHPPRCGNRCRGLAIRCL